MTKIRTLPEHVINKIAAGEVVERPASIVKELVENSIDAKATHLIITLRNGGKSLIEVNDNGSGIPAEELSQAFLRHATSKIEKIDDLETLISLGFRGEALASIAAVSTVYIESAIGKDAAQTMIINHGKTIEQGKASRVQGTTIRVEHLFAKIPARKKFLKSDRQELAVITKLIQELALSYPHIHFELYNDGKKIINTTSKTDLLERFYDIFSRSGYSQMLPVESADHKSGIKIQGVISSPVLKRATRTQQMICINGRVIRDFRLCKVIEDAYHGFLLSSEHPIFFLHLTLPTNEIDINVHPRKTEIRFAYPEQIMSALYTTVKTFLTEQILTVPVNKFVTKSHNNLPNFVAETPTSYQLPRNPSAQTPDSDLKIEQLFTEVQVPMEEKPIKVLSQIKNSYILCEAKESLMLFDQHAAHERFIYEELKRSADKKTTQPLLTPIGIQVTAEQNVLLSEYHHLYENFGFTLEQHSPTSWLITQVPVSKKSLDYENIILATLEQTNKDSFAQTLTAKKDDILHTMACKAAVKFNDRLSIPELQNLIDNVAYLPGIYTCPHGRPFRLELKFSELNSYFKRI